MPVAAARRFEKFFEATSDCQFYVKRDVDGRFKYQHVNPAALSVTGRSNQDDILGLTPVEALGPEYGATVEANILEAYQRGEAFHFRGRLGHGESGPVYDACYFPLLDQEGNIAGVLGSARDISEITHLNEALVHSQKLEALGTIAGGVVHDFNNIMASLGALLHLLDKQDIEPARRDLIIREGKKTLENGMALTKRLTAFSRKETIQAVPHDVERLVSSSLPLVRRVLGKQVQLEVQLQTDLWKGRCDRGEFEISMVNLATNARHAMKGTGNVLITARNNVRGAEDPVNWPCEYVEITFKDDGCGMSDETMRRATEPFFTTKPVGEGTGLGLSGIAKFAHDIGGALRVESALGQGTAISILLPKEHD